MSDVKADRLIQAYLRLRQEVADIEGSIKDRVKEKKDLMGQIEAWFLKASNTTGVESFKTGSGTAYLSIVTSLKTEDKDLFLEHVKNTGNYELLDARPLKSAVQEYMEDHDVPPPGVNVSKIRKINVRSPR